MKAQLPGIHTASEQLTAVCTELDRLARRIESIRNAVLTSTAAAAVVAFRAEVARSLRRAKAEMQ